MSLICLTYIRPWAIDYGKGGRVVKGGKESLVPTPVPSRLSATKRTTSQQRYGHDARRYGTERGGIMEKKNTDGGGTGRAYRQCDADTDTDAKYIVQMKSKNDVDESYPITLEKRI